MSETAYITVATRSPNAVPSYLYSHSSIIVGPVLDSTRTLHLFIVKTEGDRAIQFAEGQAERLSSGLHPSRAFPQLSDAVEHVNEIFGVRL